jgi:hypothetical protein
MLLAPLMVTQDTAATPHDFVGFFVLQLAMSAVPLLVMMFSTSPNRSAFGLQESVPMRAVHEGRGDGNADGPPSYHESLVRSSWTAAHDAFCSCRRLMAVSSYRWLLASGSMSAGCYWAMVLLQQQMLRSLGVSSAIAWYVSSAEQVVGVLVAAAVLVYWLFGGGKFSLVLAECNPCSVDDMRKLIVMSNWVTFGCFSLLYLLLVTSFPDITKDDAVASAWRAATASTQAMVAASLFLLSLITVASQCVTISMLVAFTEVTASRSVEGASRTLAHQQLLFVGASAVSLFLVQFGQYLMKPSPVSRTSDDASPESAINTATFLLRIGLLPGFTVHGI